MPKFVSRTAYYGLAVYSGATALAQRPQLYDALQAAGVLTDSNRTTVTATSSLLVTQCGPLLVDATAGPVVLTLPGSGAATDEAVYEIHRLDATANALTITAAGADTIDGAASVTMTGTLKLRLPAGSTVWRVHSISGATPAKARAAIGVIPATATDAGIVELATDAEALTGTDTTRALTPAGLRAGLSASGSAPIFGARAWGNFNGQGTIAIRAGGNFLSVTDGGAGVFRVNFTTAMADANYAALIWWQTAADGNFMKGGADYTASGFAFEYSNTAGGGLTDPARVTFAVFR